MSSHGEIRNTRQTNSSKLFQNDCTVPQPHIKHFQERGKKEKWNTHTHTYFNTVAQSVDRVEKRPKNFLATICRNGFHYDRHEYFTFTNTHTHRQLSRQFHTHKLQLLECTRMQPMHPVTMQFGLDQTKII